MLRLRRILALLLLTLWLPATLHCALGSTLLASDHHCVVGDEGHLDACDLVENGAYLSGSDSATLPPPALQASLLVFLYPPPEVLSVVAENKIPAPDAGPPEIARTWQFVTRAAPPARAPASFVL